MIEGKEVILNGILPEAVINSDYFIIGWKIFLILFLAFLLKFIFGLIFKGIEKNIEEEKKEQARIRKTRISLLKKISSLLIFSLAFIFILFFIPGFKNVAYSLVAGAGIAAIVVGFAAQESLSNIIAGVSIALYAPFRVGDKLQVFEERGEVEDITLRHTVIKTWDNRRLVIPNAIMDNKEIVNYSLKGERVLWTLNMGISYDSDIDKAKKVMLKEVKKHPNNLEFEEKVGGKNEKREPFIRVTECGDSAVNLRAYFWVEDAWKAWKTTHDLTESIKKEFDKKNIEIPFSYHTIVYKKDLEDKMKGGEK